MNALSSFMIQPMLALLLCGIHAQPTEPPPEAESLPLTVSELRFEGLVNVQRGECLDLIVTREGQPYSDQTLSEDVRRLIRSGRFLDVQIALAPQTGGTAVIFKLQERPIIAAVEFVGNEEFSDKKLLKQLEIKPGDPLNVFAARQGAAVLRDFYQEEGYNEASITLDETALDSELRIVYHITEGPLVRLREIAFEGNVHFEEDQLKSKIESKTYIPIFRSGHFSEQQAEQDALALQTFLRERGFLDAQVGYRAESLPEDEGVALVFVIEEGDLYYVDAIEFEGNIAFSNDELLETLKLASGAIMRLDLLKKDLDAIRQLYGENGYLYATVQGSRVFTPDPGRVRLRFSISEGDSYLVGRVVIRGNQQTQDKVVRRQLSFYPGTRYDTTALKESEQNLRATRLFQSATITPVGQDEKIRDALVDVVESEDTVRFLVGGGVGSNSGLGGMFSFESLNFDLTDWPRSSGEFWRGRAFRGAGQYFRIEASPGTEQTTFSISFREPFLLDRPVQLGTNFYLFERIREEYDEQRLGTVISLGRYFEEGWLGGWAGEIALRLEDVTLEDLEPFSAEEIVDAEGHSLISSLKVRLTRNRTDSQFLPSDGDVFSVSVEQAAGDYTFTKLQTYYEWYHTLDIDELDRKKILGLKGEVGYIGGDAPVFDRFYAGGIGTIRGFEFRGVTPRGGPFFNDDQRIGGDFRLLLGAEYTFPLWSEMMRGVVFTDMGTVEENVGITQWRASVGFGLRLYIERLGPIPFEFNFAAPIMKDEDDDTQVFSFNIGLSF